ncbi:hypothetical protein ACIBTP_25800 [Streptomyces avidinii]|uniref:hypothetical protein n=1 Tax=Streptomyces avidinii TaxID=1895 RepID=UPI0037AC41BD
MGTSWDAVEPNNRSSITYDREYADRKSRRLAAENPTRADFSDHYAEEAAAREAAKRETEDYLRSLQWAKEYDETREDERRFEATDPRPAWPDRNDSDYHEKEGEWIAWQGRQQKYLARAEGERLAARISRRW